jgi:undecaprenyl-diphosphatase
LFANTWKLKTVTKLNAILGLDARVTEQLRIAEEPGVLRLAAMFFAHSGDSWFWGLGLLLVLFFGDGFWRQRALYLGVSSIITAVIVLVMKFSVRRRRPEGKWGGIYRSTDPHSFPSGHAARSFMLAVMAIGLGPPWLAVLLSLWAPLVGLARVAMGVHYLSDVAAGGLMGILLGLVNYHFLPIMLHPWDSLF